MYDLAIIGGMGPEATLEFFKKIIIYTESDKDQDHINVFILNKSSIPDRTSYILGCGESPVVGLNNCIDDLLKIGTKVLAIPCNTAHYFIDYLKIPSNIKFVNMISETMDYVYRFYPDQKVCILGTIGTIKGKVYEKYDTERKVIYPNEDDQLVIMDIIKEIKGGCTREIIIEKTQRIVNKIRDYHSNCIFVIACTELSVISHSIELERGIIVDSLDLLAIRSIEECGYQVKKSLLKKLNLEKVKS
jgi:aspartate racemase